MGRSTKHAGFGREWAVEFERDFGTKQRKKLKKPFRHHFEKLGYKEDENNRLNISL
jgi:hypothetical protein